MQGSIRIWYKEPFSFRSVKWRYGTRLSRPISSHRFWHQIMICHCDCSSAGFLRPLLRQLRLCLTELELLWQLLCDRRCLSRAEASMLWLFDSESATKWVHCLKLLCSTASMVRMKPTVHAARKLRLVRSNKGVWRDATYAACRYLPSIWYRIHAPKIKRK